MCASSFLGGQKIALGDIFENTKKLGKKVEELEMKMENNNSSTIRQEYNKANAELIRHMKTKDSYFRQKARLKLFKEGDCNTKFFHSIINNKRMRLRINIIKNDVGNWIEGEDEIVSEAVSFFQKQFTQEEQQVDWSILNCIPKRVTNADNENLTFLPTLEEVNR